MDNELNVTSDHHLKEIGEKLHPIMINNNIIIKLYFTLVLKTINIS